MAVRVTFLLLVFTSLLASHECSRSSIHGNELGFSASASNKIVLRPCSHDTCSGQTQTKLDVSLLKRCWCCISAKRPLCYATRADCEANCQFEPPRDLGTP
ncbi:hypothetical protein DITRI_Ditri12bG0026500 [Diplodiscus trichospermus]